MKEIIVLLMIFSLGNLVSQDLNCLKPEFYDYDFDIIEVRSEKDSIFETTQFKSDSLKLYVERKSILKFPKWSSYKRKGIKSGFKIVLLNNTNNDLNLFNMDGRIIMRRQVFYKNKWRNLKRYKDTERFYCGNSFFRKRTIKSKQILTFIAPCIFGNKKAKFRFILGRNYKNNNLAICSNEFEGFIDEKLIEM
ncbi:hypothetical protein JL193_01190 [Polaribacter batillariae]|uniref:Uncharacterized protein n=1 Tax=Polaribacter batillariae TaxID=2808900 RepID=A0ABX7SUN4_9FLAO|nr:hypothetical protein [Polaribacter batillariae]QTD37952.1 hypothetical protein JL193_01190 [Polaribacter batillariae]